MLCELAAGVLILAHDPLKDAAARPFYMEAYMYGKTCGERVRILRSKNAETMVDFGNRIGGHLNTVSNWERGIALPSAESIMTICEEYNVSADWLLGLAPLDAMRPVGWNREARKAT